MTAVVEVTALVNHLNNVQTELSLNNLRHLTRLKLLNCICKRLYPTLKRCRLKFSTAHCCTVNRVHTSHSRELHLSGNNLLTHLKQTLTSTALCCLHTLRVLSDVCIYILLGNNRHLLLICTLVEALNLSRNNLYLVDNLVLHSGCIGLLLHLATHKLADVVDRHMALALKLKHRASLRGHLFNALLYTLYNVVCIDLNRVNQCLVVQQFLHKQLLQRLVHRVTV